MFLPSAGVAVHPNLYRQACIIQEKGLSFKPKNQFYTLFRFADIRKPHETTVSWGPRSGRADPFKTCTKWQVGRLHDVSLLPTSSRPSKGRREACSPHHEGASRLRDVGLNKTRHAPSRNQFQILLIIFIGEEGLHKLLIDQIQLLIAVQGGELILAVHLDHL